MSMLAERKRKEKWSLNPRGKSWSSDKNKFGQRLLEKMGWSEGQGLGANNQGQTEIVKVQKKDDIKGLGFKEKGEEWLKTTSEFNELLDQLGSSQGENTDDQSDLTSSLEDRSKKSKARVHYHKFTRGKDLSRYSEKDLASIIGPEVARPKNSEGKNINYTSNQVNKGSSEEYFAQKKPLKRNTPIIENTQEENVNLNNNNSFDPPKRKKSKKARNQENDSVGGVILNSENKQGQNQHEESIPNDKPSLDISLAENKKKKKKKKMPISKDDSIENDNNKRTDTSNNLLQIVQASSGVTLSPPENHCDSENVTLLKKERSRKRNKKEDPRPEENSQLGDEAAKIANPETPKKKKKKHQPENSASELEYESVSTKKKKHCINKQLQSPVEKDETSDMTSQKEKQKKSIAKTDNHQNQVDHAKSSNNFLEVLGRKTRLKQINNPSKGLSQTNYDTSEFMSLNSDSHAISQSSNMKNESNSKVTNSNQQQQTVRKENGIADIRPYLDALKTVTKSKQVLAEEFRLLAKRCMDLCLEMPKEPNIPDLPEFAIAKTGKALHRRLSFFLRIKDLRSLLPKPDVEEIKKSIKAFSARLEKRSTMMNLLTQIEIKILQLSSQLTENGAVSAGAKKPDTEVFYALEQLFKKLEALITDESSLEVLKSTNKHPEPERPPFETRIIDKFKLFSKQLSLLKEGKPLSIEMNSTKKDNSSVQSKGKQTKVNKSGFSKIKKQGTPNSSVKSKGKQTKLNQSGFSKTKKQGTPNKRGGKLSVQGISNQSGGNRGTFKHYKGTFNRQGAYNQNVENFHGHESFNQGFSQRGRGGFRNVSRGAQGASGGQRSWRNQQHFREQEEPREVNQGVWQNHQSFRGLNNQQSRVMRGRHGVPTKGWGPLRSISLPEHAKFHGSHRGWGTGSMGRGNFRGQGRGRGGPKRKGVISQTNQDAKQYAEKCKAEQKIPECVFKGVDLKHISGYASEKPKESKES